MVFYVISSAQKPSISMQKLDFDDFKWSFLWEAVDVKERRVINLFHHAVG
jgi:hypothetical protein